jgi:uncharacterized membrane protein
VILFITMRLIFTLLLFLFPHLAHAEFKLCNQTNARIGVSIGYKEGNGWATEGWWNIQANGCETILQGNLSSRYYYLYALDYDKGGTWGGRSFMCSREKEFTIRGLEDCLARGYDRTGFIEIDTQDQKEWTVQLVDSKTPAVSSGVKLPLTIMQRKP